eukprot:scaffold256421_cov17-Prasinocladus_malaysianus.AAC.1
MAGRTTTMPGGRVADSHNTADTIHQQRQTSKAESAQIRQAKIGAGEHLPRAIRWRLHASERQAITHILPVPIDSS